MLSKLYNIFRVYFILLPILAIFEVNIGLNYLLLALFLLGCFYSFIKFYNNNVFYHDRTFGTIILIFLVISCISWMISPKILIFSGETFNTEGEEKYRTTSTQLIASIQVLCTYYIVYYLTVTKKLNPKTINNFAYILLVIALLRYIIGLFSLDTDSIEAANHGVANNAGYVLVMLLPLLSLKTITTTRFKAIMLITLVLVLVSAKRGAILAVSIASIIWIYYVYLKKSSFQKKISAFIVLLFIGLTSIYIVESSDNLRTKLEDSKEGNSSGRDIMYLLLLEKWMNASTQEKILGIQYNASYTLLGVDAHNDWLELLTGQGLLGVSLYIALIVYMSKYYNKNSKYLTKSEKFAYVLILWIWVIKSLMSQVFYSASTSYFIIVIGYLMANIDKKKYLITCNKKS